MVYLDVLGGNVQASPVIVPVASGPVRLVRICKTSSSPPVLRVTLFLRELLKPKIISTGKTLEVVFQKNLSEKNESPSKLINSEQSPIPYPLMSPESPNPATNSPLIINFEKIDASKLLRELAVQAGMNVHFRDPLEKIIDLKGYASSPLDAMGLIVKEIGGSFSVEDGEIWISMKQNPLLAFSEKDFIQGADLRGLALGDVLRALGQIGSLNVILDRSLDAIKEKPVDILLSKMSYRRAFENILRNYSLIAQAIDSKTFLILTEKAARIALGSSFRVISSQTPLAKLKELLKPALNPEILERVSLQEDLGNVLLIGDKEAVDQVQATIEAIQGKMINAGESIRRLFYSAVNTKPEELAKLVAETLGPENKPQISVDARSDVLIISGYKPAVERALEVMKNLDHPPTRQAVIRIRLLEIHLQDLKNLGVRLNQDTITVNDIGNLPTQVAIPAVLAYLEDDSKVKTLANPTLRCMDKEEASIDISEQIPVKNIVTDYLPVASSSLAARTTDNWTTSSIGVKLKVKPNIYIDKQVSLDVNADFTELVRMVEGHPWTATRNIKTRIRVKSGETIIMGGLIRQKRSEAHHPLPLIRRIPILRKLLKPLEWRDESKEETEMVILITPVVVGPDTNLEIPTAQFQENHRPSVNRKLGKIDDSKL
ncbi:hypothetical protein HYY75_04355 [bacterium]|nr:hypothetical protein [bacterium]